MKILRFILMVAACCGLVSLGHAAPLVASNAKVRLVPPVSDSSAAYVTLRNTGAQPVTIVGVSSPVCRKAMMHRANMEAMPRVTVAAHGEMRFAPGGDHIMLMGLRRGLRVGERVLLLLHLGDGSEMRFNAAVVDMR